ncbi:MAG: thioesterase family protein [Gammaproteobacteria bacterium]|nr:thioesterase family protein [Gammaproteobacteria bacterium]
MATEPAVVERQDGLWHPSPLAAGPFSGMHGGVIAACLLTAMAERPEAAYGEAAVINVQLLRAPSLAAFEVRATAVRSGRRSASLEATLSQNGKDMARATAMFATAVELPGVEVPTLPPTWLDDLPAPSEDRVGTGPWSLQTEWFWRAFDVRLDHNDGFWFRPRLPVIAGAPAAATLVAIADWSSGLFRPDRKGPRRILAWPNAELSVHLARPAAEIDAAGWFGVSGDSAWNGLGWGYTGATLRDPAKLLGRSAQACILTPAESTP